MTSVRPQLRSSIAVSHSASGLLITLLSTLLSLASSSADGQQLGRRQRFVLIFVDSLSMIGGELGIVRLLTTQAFPQNVSSPSSSGCHTLSHMNAECHGALQALQWWATVVRGLPSSSTIASWHAPHVRPSAGASPPSIAGARPRRRATISQIVDLFGRFESRRRWERQVRTAKFLARLRTHGFARLGLLRRRPA